MTAIETYDQLRHLADSWGLVLLGVIFLALVGWTFRKGASRDMDTAATSIFQDDDHGK